MQKSIAICLFTALLVLPFAATAQFFDPESAGLFTVTGNLDVSAGYATLDNDDHNYGLDGIGQDPATQDEEFVYWGLDNDGWCGSIMTIVSDNGVEVLGSYFTADDGTDFLWDLNRVEYGLGEDGYSWATGVTGDEATGQFIGCAITWSQIIPDSAGSSWVQELARIGKSCAGLAYFQSPDVQTDASWHQRYDRDGGVVGPGTYGRNTPAGHAVDDTNWFVDTVGSRCGGASILSNGNSVFVIYDRARNDDRTLGSWNHFTGGGNNTGDQRTNFFAIASSDHSTWVNPGQLVFTDTRRNGNCIMGCDASPNGWWATCFGGGLAVFKNDSTNIAEMPDLAGLVNAEAGAVPAGMTVNGFNNDSDCSVGDDMIYIAASVNDGAVDRPAVARFQVDPAGAGSVTILPIIVPDDDFGSVPGASIVTELTDVGANDAGDFVTGWRHPENFAPVMRVYNKDGSPASGSFYPSLIGTNDNLSNGTTLTGDSMNMKVAMSGNQVCGVWKSDNGDEGISALNCVDQPKIAPVTEVGRIFSTDSGVIASEVENWNLFD